MIPRYTLPEAASIWTDEARFGQMLRVELAVLRVMARRGDVPAEAAAAIEQRARVDVDRIADLERTTDHDVIAFVSQVAESVGEEGRYLHFGLTSSDVVDTALALQCRAASDLVLAALDGLIAVLVRRAREHAGTVVMGRTHGVHAEPMTFGLKLASWAFELDRDRARLAAAADDLATGKLSGPVGTYSHLPPAVEADALADLDLTPDPVSTQIVQRDRHAAYLAAIAVTGGSIERFAVEVRNLQHTEIGEVQEPFRAGQKGSSAMPHKRNPILSERLTGLARLLRGFAVAGLEDQALWHERDISHSSVERVALPGATTLLHYMLVRFTDLVRDLVVRPERMAENVERGLGLHASSRVLDALVTAGLPREAAYATVQRTALRAADERRPLRELLESDPDVTDTIDAGALAHCFDDAAHLSHVPAIISRLERLERGTADRARVKRALVSVSDKTGVVEFARALVGLGFELVSTGGTAAALRDADLPVTEVADVTGAPEMLGGRVKTLHPRIAAGVLADRRDPDHVRQLADAGVEPFDVVCVNLYRFEEAAARGADDEALIEEIDIGGPTLVRAAAKNHASVAIVTDPADYPIVLAELREHGSVTADTRRRLALAAYRLTAAYDAAIAAELGARWAPDERLPERLTLPLRRHERLRYGENPHQVAALYLRLRAQPTDGPFAAGGTLLAGKPLSYNNILDASAAASIARDLVGDAVVIVKHTNPCGVAEASDLVTAWQRALDADPVSAFGGVVGVRGIVTGDLAHELTRIFLEVVVAAGFSDEALAMLSSRPDLRLLADASIVEPPAAAIVVRSAGGAVLVSDADTARDDPATWRTATRRAPTEQERSDLDLAWRVVRHVTSNAIVLARAGVVVGVGAGQMSRVESARIAVERAGERARGAACASEAFFPFADGVQVVMDAGVSAVIQPGGSKRDDEVIAAVDAADATMLLTGRRHFRH